MTKQVPPSEGACKPRGETGSSSLTPLSCPVWLDFHSERSSLSIGSRFWRLQWKRQNAPVYFHQTRRTSTPCRVELLQDYKSLFYPTTYLREEREILTIKQQERKEVASDQSPHFRKENQGPQTGTGMARATAELVAESNLQSHSPLWIPHNSLQPINQNHFVLP